MWGGGRFYTCKMRYRNVLFLHVFACFLLFKQRVTLFILLIVLIKLLLSSICSVLMLIINSVYNLPRRLASEGIVTLGVTLSRCACVRRAAYITYRLHAALVSAAKVMRCIQH